MGNLIEMYVRYRGRPRFLRLIERDGDWHAALLIPGEVDLFGDCPPRAPPGAVLPRADLGDDSTFRIEAPKGKVTSLAALRLIASGSVGVRDGWIAVPLRSITRDYRDAQGDRIPEPDRAAILDFPSRKTEDRDTEPER